MAKCQNLNHMRGDNISRSLLIGDRATNTPIDITGYTFYYTLKNSNDDLDVNAVYQKSWTDHVDAENGQTNWAVAASVTKDLSGDYYYDISMIDNAGEVTTILYGIATFNKDTTRAVA